MYSIAFLLSLLASPVTASTDAYAVSKLVEQKADLYCQSLALILLHQEAYTSVITHTKPKILGTSYNGKKLVVVGYQYRADGVSFACSFYDYTNGLLQLVEFGHVGPDSEELTKVRLLW